MLILSYIDKTRESKTDKLRTTGMLNVERYCSCISPYTANDADWCRKRSAEIEAEEIGGRQFKEGWWVTIVCGGVSVSDRYCLCTIKADGP